MPLFELSSNRFEPVPDTTFQKNAIRERRDLQRILRDQIEVIDSDMMVVAEEFSDWVHSDLRIDLLCLDRAGNLVVIELKRDDRGGYSELQAIRYAAMAEGATFEQIVKAYRSYRQRRHDEDSSQPELDATESAQELLRFLGWDQPDEEHFGADVRIVLVSADYSVPLTTAAFWLRKKGIDIRCFRMIPYLLNADQQPHLLVDVQQLVPLPEIAELTDRMADKEERRRETRLVASSKDYTRFDIRVAGRPYKNLAKRRAALEVVRAAIRDLGIDPQAILDETIEGQRRKYRPILLPFEGDLNQAEFETRVQDTFPKLGIRYFTDEDDLIHANHQTWAFTSQWGTETRAFIDELGARYPELRLDISEATDVGE